MELIKKKSKQETKADKWKEPEGLDGRVFEKLREVTSPVASVTSPLRWFVCFRARSAQKVVRFQRDSPRLLCRLSSHSSPPCLPPRPQAALRPFSPALGLPPQRGRHQSPWGSASLWERSLALSASKWLSLFVSLVVYFLLRSPRAERREGRLESEESALWRGGEVQHC